MKKLKTLGVCVLALCAVIAIALPLSAQNMNKEKPPVYTYVAEWSVPRAQWGDMDKLADADKAMMDKLLADGTIVSYGAYSNIIHQEGEPTHGSWFSSTSEGNLLKALEAIYKQPNMVGSPVQAASKHWDMILVDRNYNAKPGNVTGGYLMLSKWQIKPGEAQSYSQLQKTQMIPILEKLLANGTITSYGYDMEDFHQGPIGQVWEYVTIPDAASIDKVNQAFEEAFGNNPALSGAYRATTEREGHRDYLLHLRYMASK